MIEKLKQVEERYNFINDRLCSPEIAADASLSTPLLKELKTLTPVVEKYREYVKTKTSKSLSVRNTTRGGKKASVF